METNALRFCSVPSPAKFWHDRPTDGGVVSRWTNPNYSMINLLLYPTLESSAPQNSAGVMVTDKIWLMGHIKNNEANVTVVYYRASG